MSKKFPFAAVSLLGCFAGQGLAQAPVPRDVEELRKIHEDDERERALAAPKPPLPKPSGVYPETYPPLAPMSVASSGS